MCVLYADHSLRKRTGTGNAPCVCGRSVDRGRCLCGNGIYDSSYGRDHTGLREGEFMETILGHVKELVERGENIGYIIAFLNGWTETEAKLEPEKTYTTAEMKELFDLLYDILTKHIYRN